MDLFAEYKKRDANDARPRLSNGVAIRWATEGDLSQVARLSADRNGTTVDAERPRMMRTLEQSAEGEALLFVAECENKVAGFGKAAIWNPGSQGALPPPEGWYLTGVIVDPKYRRLGIGEALTQARLAALKRHCEAVRFVASAQNKASIALHARLGFEEELRGIETPSLSFTGGLGILYKRFL